MHAWHIYYVLYDENILHVTSFCLRAKCFIEEFETINWYEFDIEVRTLETRIGSKHFAVLAPETQLISKHVLII